VAAASAAAVSPGEASAAAAAARGKKASRTNKIGRLTKQRREIQYPSRFLKSTFMGTPDSEPSSITYSSAITSLPAKYTKREDVTPEDVQECLEQYQEAGVPELTILELIQHVDPLVVEDVDMAITLASYHQKSEQSGCPVTTAQLGEIGKAMLALDYNPSTHQNTYTCNRGFGAALKASIPLHENKDDSLKQAWSHLEKVQTAAGLIFAVHKRNQPALDNRARRNIQDIFFEPVEAALEKGLIKDMEQLKEICSLVITLGKSTGGRWQMEKIVEAAPSLKVLKYLLNLCIREVFPWFGLSQICGTIDLQSLEQLSDEILEKSLTIQLMADSPSDLSKFLVANGAKLNY
jgi:hypothetical protein